MIFGSFKVTYRQEPLVNGKHQVMIVFQTLIFEFIFISMIALVESYIVNIVAI